MIDWLFWIWVIVTILAFLNLIIPDPLPFVDEAILILIFFALLGALIVRMIVRGITSLVGTITHPAVIAFVATLIILFIYDRFKKKKKKKKKR